LKTAVAVGLPSEPAVLDESQHGGLVGNCMVDEVAIGPGEIATNGWRVL